ncbi:hypothetical protein [Devriesea agamarum]|uniref:hypothetical protein n=1 Tax=Devriesea agamarum TaxID=472569 RepID=UPI0012ECF0DC|nr:hypothetical protein [Devriesea agamarum]
MFEILLAVDPGVKIDSGFWPFTKIFQQSVGGLLFILIIASVATFAISGVMLAVAKLSNSQKVANVSTTILGWTLLGAAVVGSASGLVAWASGLKLF